MILRGTAYKLFNVFDVGDETILLSGETKRKKQIFNYLSYKMYGCMCVCASIFLKKKKKIQSLVENFSYGRE